MEIGARGAGWPWYAEAMTLPTQCVGRRVELSIVAAAIFLAGGAVLTTAVAWVLHLLPTGTSSTYEFEITGKQTWYGRVSDRPGAVDISQRCDDVYRPFGTWLRSRDIPPSKAPLWTTACLEPSEALGHEDIQADDHASGWPMLAFRCSKWTWTSPQVPWTAKAKDSPELTSPFWQLQRADVRPHGIIPLHWAADLLPTRLKAASLPALPIWRGFLVDTAIYTACLGIPWRTWIVIRRRRRRHHSQCLRCGYALAGLAEGAVCPECGTLRA